VDRPIKQK
jgi:mitogen-activated protein kinase 1/3